MVLAIEDVLELNDFIPDLEANERYEIAGAAANVMKLFVYCPRVYFSFQMIHSDVFSQYLEKLSRNLYTRVRTLHTELKYSIAGVEFQPAKQFILSSFVLYFYLSRWSNGLRHLTCSQKTVGSIPT